MEFLEEFEERYLMANRNKLASRGGGQMAPGTDLSSDQQVLNVYSDIVNGNYLAPQPPNSQVVKFIVYAK